MLFRQSINKSQIEQTIAQLEQHTSAELRVCVERKLPVGMNVMQQAMAVFQQLEMEKTVQRNGVLIYLAWQSRQCAIIGDTGINAAVEPTFWQQCCDHLVEFAKKKQYSEGIVSTIRMLGECLAYHFPYQENDCNELPNEVVIK